MDSSIDMNTYIVLETSSKRSFSNRKQKKILVISAHGAIRLRKQIKFKNKMKAVNQLLKHSTLSNSERAAGQLPWNCNSLLLWRLSGRAWVRNSFFAHGYRLCGYKLRSFSGSRQSSCARLSAWNINWSTHVLPCTI